jgi:tetratricopeptide (TPR) repeat protein
LANEALKLYPLHLDAAFILAELFLLKEKDDEKAISYLEKSIKLYRKIKNKNLHRYSDFEYVSFDSAPHFFYELSRIYASQNKKNDAKKLLEEVINEIDAHHEASYYSLLIYDLNDKNIADFLDLFDRYWNSIEKKNSTILDTLRTKIIFTIKENNDSDKLLNLFFCYVKTLDYEIGKRYDTKTIEDYERLFENSPNDLYPEWIASVLLSKYYENKMIQKVIKIAKFLIGKDKDMDRVLKIMLLKLKESGE